MDDLNNTFNWRWMLDSVQPQGPTGGSVGALFKDMRDSMKGGPGGNVDKAFAMNKALRGENVAYGNSLGDLEKENDKHNLAWANFKNSLNSQSNQRAGHLNKLAENYISALNSGDKSAIEFIRKQIKNQYPEDAEQIFATAEESAAKNAEQYSNYVNILGGIDDIINTENKTSKRAEILKAKEDGLITTKQAEQLLNTLQGKYNPDTVRSQAIIGARAGKKGSDVVEQDESKLFDEILKQADPNASKTPREEWARKKFREIHGKEYKGKGGK
jgi:hypothetical protein